MVLSKSAVGATPCSTMRITSIPDGNPKTIARKDG
jgi:hypothetical protein